MCDFANKLNVFTETTVAIGTAMPAMAPSGKCRSTNVQFNCTQRCADPNIIYNYCYVLNMHNIKFISII